MPTDEYDTLGGWVTAELGRIPRRGDTVHREGLIITVVGADAKRVLWLNIQHDEHSTLAGPDDNN